MIDKEARKTLLAMEENYYVMAGRLLVMEGYMLSQLGGQLSIDTLQEQVKLFQLPVSKLHSDASLKEWLETQSVAEKRKGDLLVALKSGIEIERGNIVESLLAVLKAHS